MKVDEVFLTYQNQPIRVYFSDAEIYDISVVTLGDEFHADVIANVINVVKGRNSLDDWKDQYLDFLLADVIRVERKGKCIFEKKCSNHSLVWDRERPRPF